MTKLTRIVAILGVAAAAIAVPAASSQAAATSQGAAASLSAISALSPFGASKPATASKRRACGFLGGEVYNHCSTWTHVLLDARNIWGTTYRNICVGPGRTHLGYLSRWVIQYAWYIGRRC